MELPFLSEYEQSLASHWFELGTVQQTAGGLVALDWGQIIEWACYFYSSPVIEMVEHPRHSKRHKITYTPVVLHRSSLTDWELHQIKNMSNAYVNEYAETSPSRMCPKEVIIEDISEEDALVNANSMEDALDKLLS